MVTCEGRKEMGQRKGKKVSSTAPVFDFFLKERKRYNANMTRRLIFVGSG